MDPLAFSQEIFAFDSVLEEYFNNPSAYRKLVQPDFAGPIVPSPASASASEDRYFDVATPAPERSWAENNNNGDNDEEENFGLFPVPSWLRV